LNPEVGRELAEQTARVVLSTDREGLHRKIAAERLGISYGTLRHRLRVCRDRFHIDIPRITPNKKPAEPERPVFPDKNLPIEKYIDGLCDNFEKQAEYEAAREWFTIKMPDDRPWADVYFGDPHIDSNPGCNWPKLREDCATVAKTDGMYGVDVGDVVDGWGARLAHLYAESDTSVENSWRLVEWFYNEALTNKKGANKWKVRIRGNHDQMRLDVPEVLDRICKYQVPAFKDEAKFYQKCPNGFVAPCWVRHDFPGHSQWWGGHSMQKAALMKSAAGLYVCGHKHNWMLHHDEHPDQGFVYWLARARGYKFFDSHTKKLGYSEQQYGCSLVAVYNPKARSEPGRLQCYVDVQEAAEYLTYLRKKHK